MSDLTAYGYCILLTLLILAIGAMILRSAMAFFIIIFPAIIASGITGERQNYFSPNGGSSNNSPFFYFVFVVSIFAQIFLLAGIFFGFYKIYTIFVPPAPVVKTIDPVEVLSALELNRLLAINLLLWIFTIGFIAMLLFNFISLGDKIKEIPKKALIMSYGVAVIGYPFIIFFLTVTRKFLNHFPSPVDGRSLTQLVGVICVIYCLYSLIRKIYDYFAVFIKYKVQQNFQYWIFTILALIYQGMFLYYTFKLMNNF